MKQKTIEFFSEFVLSKEILSIWPRSADSGPNRNNLFSIRENVLVSFPKLYRNVCPLVFDITTIDMWSRKYGMNGSACVGTKSVHRREVWPVQIT
jgi:hypothetical protein